MKYRPVSKLWKGAMCAAAILALVMSASFVVASDASAQTARHPFAVGANEGAASTGDPVSRFILGLESQFYRLLTGAVRGAKESSLAAWSLLALSFAYGVVHAAGPGHGKAVIASYLLANERTLLRGVTISAAAAVLQGTVAIAIVGAAALLFRATSKHMTQAASIVEIASYAGITLLGGILVYKKAEALLALRRSAPIGVLEPAFADGAVPHAMMRRTNRSFRADDASYGHEHTASCSHLHGLETTRDGAEPNWKTTVLTICAAGLRPCSGAILVLVFSLAQGVLMVGILSVAAMALGTAITTSVLATIAVFGKKTAERLVTTSRRSLLVGRMVEATAAVAVLLLGIVLLTASLARMA